MSETDRLKLPKIDGNMTADVVRDLNALAEAIDEKVASQEDLEDVEVPVTSVNGKEGDVNLTAEDVGAYSKEETDQKIEDILDGEDIQKMRDDIDGVSEELGEHVDDETNPHNVNSKQVNVMDSLPPSALTQVYPIGISTFTVTDGDDNHRSWVDEINSVLGTTYAGLSVRVYVTTIKNDIYSNGGIQEIYIMVNTTSPMSGFVRHKLVRGQGTGSIGADNWGEWREVLSLNDVGYVTGTYTGDGATTRDINLGFRPKAVLVESSAGFSTSSERTRGLAVENMNFEGVVELTNTGFRVFSGGARNARTNSDNATYNPFNFIVYK